MNSTDFFLKYNKKFLDYDGAFGAQCPDPIKAYFVEVLGRPSIAGNAIDYWRDISGFTRIARTPFNKPNPGDIIIWDKTQSNPYGHIGICNWSRMFDMGTFEQNNPVGSPCGFRERSYKGVLGWLRPIGLQNAPRPTIPTPVGPWVIPVTIIGSAIPGLQEQVQKWSKGTMSLQINHINRYLAYDPTFDYMSYAQDKFCIISCSPSPEIYKATITNDLKTFYAVVGQDPVTCSYEISHLLGKCYNVNRGTNPYIEIEDTVGGVTDEQRYRKYDVVKPYMDSVILKP